MARGERIVAPGEPMSESEQRETNRRNLDERVAIHHTDANGFYGVQEFIDGENSLHPVELAGLPDLTGCGQGGTPWTAEMAAGIAEDTGAAMRAREARALVECPRQRTVEEVRS
jgi:hypothetical protein